MRGGRRRRRRLIRVAMVLALLAAAAIVYLLAGRIGGRAARPPAPQVGAPAAPAAGKPAPKTLHRSAVPAGEPAPPTRGTAGVRIAIVIDDLGRSLADIDRLEALGVPLTYAVLPYESKTPEVDARLRADGAEILCHLPMEARDGENPGPGAIRGDEGTAELEELTRAAIAAVPGATGVNNHMGSHVTTDVPAMRAILRVVAERGLFFLDSRTIAASVAYEMALEAGIPTAQRSVFLDAERGGNAEELAFDELVRIAREKGAAIGIGHPHEATLAMLERKVPEAVASGIEFVPASYLLDRDSGPPD